MLSCRAAQASTREADENASPFCGASVPRPLLTSCYRMDMPFTQQEFFDVSWAFIGGAS